MPNIQSKQQMKNQTKHIATQQKLQFIDQGKVVRYQVLGEVN